jgi:S-adenosylmethionine-diacylglycerol 3-amino-3-carboxypropyl transferase
VGGYIGPTDALKEALSRPLAFAQVREDPTIDLDAVQRTKAHSVFMIASGGCTAAALVGLTGVRRLVMADPNAAQLALTRLKIRLLDHSPAERLRVTGHRPGAAAERQAMLVHLLEAEGLPAGSLGDITECARRGPDHYGRYEWLFAFLCESLGDGAVLVDQALRGSAVDESALEGALRPAFAKAFELKLLQRLFSPQATQNAALPFAEHFLRQALLAVRYTEPATNRFLWEMLAPGSGRHQPVWTGAPQRKSACRTEFVQGPANEALQTAEREYELVHLSNILDWLSEDEARHTLALARAALAPNGEVLVRQLNSTLDIQRLGEGFSWRTIVGADLVRQDRSFFYRALHIGTRR